MQIWVLLVVYCKIEDKLGGFGVVLQGSNSHEWIYMTGECKVTKGYTEENKTKANVYFVNNEKWEQIDFQHLSEQKQKNRF